MVEFQKLRVLHITAMYPSKAFPALGSYVKSQINSLYEHVDNDVLIIQGLTGFVPYLLAIPKILRKLYFSKFDAIHIHYGNLSSFIKLLYWGTTPLITSYCGDDLLGTITGPGRYAVKSLLFMKLNIFLSRRDTCSIVKSKVLADKIQVARRVEIVPNGVDINRFNTIDKLVARGRVGISDSKKAIMLFPANPDIPVKNFELLQAILASLGKPNVEVITFAGNIVSHEETPYYFNAADIVVFTSLSEGSPNVIKEAMACNCKIYSTNCGDVGSLLKDVRGSKVLSYDISEWKLNIESFLKDQSQVSSNSRTAILEKNLDMDSVAKKIADIYYSVVNGKRPGF